MKWLKRIFIGIAVLLITASVLLILTGNSHLFKGIANTYLIGRTGPSIDEYKIFPNRKVEAATGEEWNVSRRYNQFELPEEFLAEMEKFDPAAFLIIRRDSIVLEKYWGAYGDSSLTNSFSMAKTFVGILTCMAMDEGKIKGPDQLVGDFIPKFKDGMNASLTIKDLLTMSSGMNFDESYGDPFGFMAKAYYGDNLKEKTLQYDVVVEPGTEFEYLGGNTILLSLIVSQATGMTLSEYCSEKLWKPIGAERDALWNLDEEGGIEKAYCCFYSNARDFARIGKLFMHKGNWNGVQLLDSNLVEQSLKPAELKGQTIDYYGWQWWIGNYNAGPFFYARGILGQYVICIPERELIIVRLGHKRSTEKIGNHIKDVFDYQDLAIELDKFMEN